MQNTTTTATRTRETPMSKLKQINGSTAKDAIRRSVTHDEVVRLTSASQDDEDTLLAECDDTLETSDSTDYWGVDDEGNLWRVCII